MILTLASRMGVVALLVYSGLTKAGSPEVAKAAQAFGLSRRVAKGVGRWLAPAELLVAGLLFLGPTAYLGAVAALVLFLVFTCLVAWNLWQGRKPACACFGEASAGPISSWTLVRNVVFVLLALVVVLDGLPNSGQSLLADVASLIATAGTSTALAAIILTNAIVVLGVLARRGGPGPAVVPTSPRPDGRPESIGWPPGTLAPSFGLPSLDGKRVMLQDLLARERSLLLFFTSHDCRHCIALFPEISQWQERHSGALTVALVSRGSAFENRARAEEFGIRDLLLQGGSEVAEAFQALATPSAVVINGDRRIASRVATGAVEIRELVEAWVERSEREPAVSVMSPPPPADPARVLAGDPAPPFKLPAVRGGAVDLEDLAGRVTVLVFWRPSCGYCRAMAQVLRAREKEEGAASAPMVFVAGGTRAANEAEGFVSPVLLDEGGAVTRAYGANGTPSAILIDAEGKVASGVAVGQEEIPALLQRADLMARAARRVLA